MSHLGKSFVANEGPEGAQYYTHSNMFYIHMFTMALNPFRPPLGNHGREFPSAYNVSIPSAWHTGQNISNAAYPGGRVF